MTEVALNAERLAEPDVACPFNTAIAATAKLAGCAQTLPPKKKVL